MAEKDIDQLKRLFADEYDGDEYENSQELSSEELEELKKTKKSGFEIAKEKLADK